MAIIMKALHVNSCQCELCGSRGQNNGHHNGVSSSLIIIESSSLHSQLSLLPLLTRFNLIRFYSNIDFCIENV